jgi:hypothetical protein
MTHYFGELSDSHVLKGEFELSRNNMDAAAQSFCEAIGRGVPIFADGSKRLWDAATTFKLDHTKVVLLDRMINNSGRGTLWSAWNPEIFSPGQMLTRGN